MSASVLAAPAVSAAPIPSAARRQFLERGYAIHSQVLNPAVVASVRDFLESRVHGCAEASSGHFDLNTRLDPRLWAIPRLPALQALLREVLDSGALFLHLPPAARFVLPGNLEAGVPPHQDLSYNRHLSDFVTVWVPLVDIDDACGGVAVYPGSAAPCEIAVPRDPQGHWLRGVSTQGYEALHCKLRVGDVLLLSKWIIHSSMPNHSSRTRLSIDYRFFGEQDSSTKHHLDLQSGVVIAP